jgi:hypothetical protein
VRGVGALLTATALVLAVGGCADEPEEDDLRTSGPLAEGFTIEPGSALIGAVFRSSQDDGMRVLLRVDSDMERVVDGYVRQAQELGHPVDAGLRRPDGQWCSDDPSAWDTSRSDAEAFALECSAYGYEPNAWTVRMRGLADADGRGYLDLALGRYTDDAAPDRAAPDGPEASVTDVEVAPDLAVPEDDPPIRLVEGSELLFEPLPSECATGGYLAMTEVTGDLAPVMRGYAEQFAEARFEGMGLVGDDDALFVGSSAAGGGTLTALGVAGDPAYVLLERCND